VNPSSPSRSRFVRDYNGGFESKSTSAPKRVNRESYRRSYLLVTKRNSAQEPRDCRLTGHWGSQDTAGSPPRRRSQTWCSLFIAPCASLFFASWTFTRDERRGELRLPVWGGIVRDIQ